MPTLPDVQPQTPPDAPPAPRIRSGVNPRREYIPVRALGGRAVQVLPRPIDDISRDFGPQHYEDMQHDPQVRAAGALMRMAVLTQILRLLPGLDREVIDEKNPEFKQAQRVATFSRRMLARLADPLNRTLFEMGQALFQGHKVAELVYDLVTGLDEAAPGAQLAVVAVKPKPNSQVAFVGDPVGNTLGVQYASASAPFTGTLTPGADGILPNFLPRAKVAIATNEPQNGDPRGRSILRAAYHGWWWRQQVWQEYLPWLATMASPTIVGTLGEEAEDRTTDDDGNLLDPPILAIDELRDTLEEVKSRGVLALPFGYTATLLQQTNAGATGAPFADALDVGTQEIWMGMTGQTRANLEAEHGSRADSETAQDQQGLVITWLTGWYEDLVVSDILAPSIVANYGEAALRFLPVASFGDTAPQDLPTLLTALASAGYTLHDSQFAAIDAMLSLEPRDPDAVAADKEAARVMQDRIAQAPPQEGQDDQDSADNPPPQGTNPPPTPKKGASARG